MSVAESAQVKIDKAGMVDLNSDNLDQNQQVDYQLYLRQIRSTFKTDLINGLIERFELKPDEEQTCLLEDMTVIFEVFYEINMDEDALDCCLGITVKGISTPQHSDQTVNSQVKDIVRPKLGQPSGDLQINIWESGEINSRIMAGDYETAFNPGELTKPQKLAAILAKII